MSGHARRPVAIHLPPARSPGYSCTYSTVVLRERILYLLEVVPYSIDEDDDRDGLLPHVPFFVNGNDEMAFFRATAVSAVLKFQRVVVKKLWVAAIRKMCFRYQTVVIKVRLTRKSAGSISERYFEKTSPGENGPEAVSDEPLLDKMSEAIGRDTEPSADNRATPRLHEGT